MSIQSRYYANLYKDSVSLMKVSAQVVAVAGIDTASVEMDKSFTEDLDIDSLSMMTIVVNAEEKFGVRIPDSEVKNLKTVRDAVTYINGAQV